jgi:hypothetical protein
LTSKFYFRLGKFFRTGKEEEPGSGNQEQDDVDGTGEVEHYNTKKHSRRRFLVGPELQPLWYSGRSDNEGICEGVTDDLMICELLSQLEG